MGRSKTVMAAKTAGKQHKAVQKQQITDDALVVQQLPDENSGTALAKTLLGAGARHGLVAAAYANSIFPPDYQEKLGLVGARRMVEDEADKAAAGDLALSSRMLASQAILLDGMFTEFARRAAGNMGAHLDAAEKYARMAMKAQSNCRTTVEALAKIHQPREQTVRHVHVGQGGQAVVADEFHHHTGGQENGSTNQSHAQGACSASLSGPDAIGRTVPIAVSEGEAALPDARRHKPRPGKG